MPIKSWPHQLSNRNIPQGKEKDHHFSYHFHTLTNIEILFVFIYLRRPTRSFINRSEFNSSDCYSMRKIHIWEYGLNEP